MTKFVVAFSILALVAAMAGNVPKGPTYTITLSQPAAVTGTTLKAGEYKVTVAGGIATFNLDKESHAVPVKVETSDKKFPSNIVQTDQAGGALKISEICVGGTKTRLLFN